MVIIDCSHIHTEYWYIAGKSPRLAKHDHS